MLNTGGTACSQRPLDVQPDELNPSANIFHVSVSAVSQVYGGSAESEVRVENCVLSALAYGVRLSSVRTFRDQLDVAPATASQIGDGSDTRTLIAHVTSVGDF